MDSNQSNISFSVDLDFVRMFFEGIRAFKESQKLMKYPIGYLAEYGWYISYQMSAPQTMEIAKLLKENNTESANNKMIIFYSQHEKKYEEEIKSAFPHRSDIIKAAFIAHRKRNYLLSIPVMLTQADGICYDLIGKNLFKKKKGSPATRYFADMFKSDDFKSSLLEPLRRVGQLSIATRRLPSTSGILNRHAVLHGLSTDYASKVNSFKIISLLTYLTQIVRKATNAKPPNQALKLTE